MVVRFQEFHLSSPSAFFLLFHIRYAADILEEDIAISDALVKCFQMTADRVNHTLFPTCDPKWHFRPCHGPPYLIPAKHGGITGQITCFGHKGIAEIGRASGRERGCKSV